MIVEVKCYCEYKKDELQSEYNRLLNEYGEYKAKQLNLDMSRGKPNSEQINITQDMLTLLADPADCFTEAGADTRNYGIFDGIPEAKRLFAELLDVPPSNIIVGGNSSLNLMYDTLVRAMLFGVPGGDKPWGKYDKVKFLCPSPGYDRHFAVCDALGIEMVTVPMTAYGPDMDVAEKIASADETVKGIWSIPKYSNPAGITYSDETVRRFAGLKTAAKDFRIMWDNAYAVHDLYETSDTLLNLFTEAKKAGAEDKLYIFTSTSKISFPGAGVAVVAASDANIKDIKNRMTYQTIGHDKINQLRHVKYFKDLDGIKNHMKKHAEFLRPKFDLVLNELKKELKPFGIGKWAAPRGGYFISLDLPDGCAKRTYNLAKEAGVTLTAAGATFPYGIDPRDSNLRIAPTYPSNGELSDAIKILCICAKIAAAEKYL
jgi:aspartate/methionine/tyrosine aminotransferase